MADIRICKEIRKVQGGYVIEGLRWPYGDDPATNGTTLCLTLQEVCERLYNAEPERQS